MKTKNNFKFPLIVCLFFYLLFWISKANAQDTITSTKQWHYLIQPYALFLNMAGTVGFSTLSNAEIDVDPHAIFSHLKSVAMLYFEANNKKWSINTDLTYMHLAQGVKSTKIINSGEVNMKQLAWELTGLYRLNPWLEVLAGTRLNNISAK